jgi:hypothetical protein
MLLGMGLSLHYERHRADADRKPNQGIHIRFGIRGFRPKLRKAEEQLRDPHTAEDHLCRTTPARSCVVTSHVSA